MRRWASLHFIGLGIAVAATGCFDSFRGSNVQIDLANGAPAQASPGATPQANQLPSNTVFTIYGIQKGATSDALFALQTFEIHMSVDIRSPCFIENGPGARFPGLHSSKYADKIAEVTGIADYKNPPASASENDKIDAATAAQRMLNIEALGGPSGIKAITSASATKYPAVAAACGGPADQIPPPMCTGDADNARRLELCQKAWDADKNLWEGTDRSLTAPLGGTTYGLVDGINPINLAPVGGAGFNVDEAVSTMDAFAIYYRSDDGFDPGTLFLYGTPTMPTRGVTKVRMTSVTNPLITANMAIFPDLGEDDVHF